MQNYLFSVHPAISIPKLYRRIPNNLKISIVSTYIIGLAAHLFMFVGTYFCGDNTSLWWEANNGISGTRFLLSFFNAFVSNTQLPWFEGIVSLFLYGLAVWFVAETLGIVHKVPIVLLAGVMVTSPTIVSNNIFLSSAHVFSFALMTASLAVYLNEKYKYGWIAAFFVLVICGGSYATYISFAVGLLIVIGIKSIIKGNKSFMQLLAKQVRDACLIGASLAFTYAISMFLAWLFKIDMNPRVAESTHRSIETILQAIKDAYFYRSQQYFKPNAFGFVVSPLFEIFQITLWLCIIVIGWNIVNKKSWKLAVLVLANIALIPIATNFFAVITNMNWLMEYSFIIPWLLFLMLYEQTSEADYPQKHMSSIKNMYGWAVIVLCSLTIIIGIRYSNINYIKAYSQNTQLISTSEHIAFDVKSIKGYNSGKTPVYFVGHADGIAGLPLYYAIQQHLGNDIIISNTTEYVLYTEPGVYVSAIGYHPADYTAEVFSQRDSSIDKEALAKKIKELPAFPQENCYMWQGETLIYNLGGLN